MGNAFDDLEISIQEGQARVNALVALGCFNSSGYMGGYSEMSLLESGPYTFSNTPNRFTALGCDSVALIAGYLSQSNSSFTNRCVTLSSNKEVIANGTCSGNGCCQTSIPVGVKDFNINMNSLHNHTRTLNFNAHSYTFLIAGDSFKFNKKTIWPSMLHMEMGKTK